MAANWASVENAIRQWVITATGISRVYWADQTQVRPATADFPFFTLRRDFGRTAGVDENRTRNNPSPVAGSEILFETFAHPDFTVTLQGFSKEVSGNSSAGALVAKCARSLALEIQLDAFAADGIALIDVGPVQNLTALLDLRFEGRAALNVRFRTTDGASQTATYIQTCVPTGTVTP